jgi:hypothetical protein
MAPMDERMPEPDQIKPPQQTRGFVVEIPEGLFGLHGHPITSFSPTDSSEEPIFLRNPLEEKSLQ